MIVIYLDELEDFLKFLGQRVSNEIFYELKELPKENDLETAKSISIILHFLGKISEDYLALYETNIKFESIDLGKAESIIIGEMKKVLDTTELGITLIKGKIREIYISYS